MRAYQTPFLDGFFGGSSYGFDGIPYHMGDETGGDEGRRVTSRDDPPWTFFHTLLHDDCDRWGARKRAGTQNGRGDGDTLLLSPNCDYEHNGAAADIANPFRSGDFNPIINSNGSAALPYRPAPIYAADSGANEAFARGNWYPNQRLQQLLRDGEFTRLDTHFSRGELEWNRGASQEPLKEMREVYLEFEAFESRLWVRAGKQTIVWGKTELFRNQDQWNPVDIAIGALPRLEESRIALWSLRGIWSFYEVGPARGRAPRARDPLRRLRADRHRALRRALRPAARPCNKSYGLRVHGQNGTGVAGEERPEDPWDNSTAPRSVDASSSAGTASASRSPTTTATPTRRTRRCCSSTPATSIRSAAIRATPRRRAPAAVTARPTRRPACCRAWIRTRTTPPTTASSRTTASTSPCSRGSAPGRWAWRPRWTPRPAAFTLFNSTQPLNAPTILTALRDGVG